MSTRRLRLGRGTGRGLSQPPSPRMPQAQPGYYPQFSTLSQQAFWDGATRALVLRRVTNVPPIRFFTAEELPLITAIYDRVIPQSDRDDAHKIAVVNYIDERLYLGHGDGYRFEGMPHDGDAHRLGMQAIAGIAQQLFGCAFPQSAPRDQDRILQSIQRGKPLGGDDIWARLPVGHYWTLLVQDGLTAYYAHPYAWDEIGFGGPSYPRGYMRLENGLPEPWEVAEQRYEWAAPEDSLSDEYRPVTEHTAGRRERRAPRPGRHSLMKRPLGGPFTSPETKGRRLGSLQTLDIPMRRYDAHDTVDVVVVGVGSAGGVLVQRLARAGLSVIGFEAGPFWDSESDWVSDEAGSRHLYWTAPRVTGGTDPITLGANNSGHGVGGGSVHWAGFTPRFHPSDFSVQTREGVGADWPLSYDELKPYYEILEREIPVSGPTHFPWGDPHGYAYAPHPPGGVANVLVRGCSQLGIRVVSGGPVAINNGAHGDRPHCIYRGFCIQGCKVGAKQSTLISHVPDAVRDHAEIRDHAMVARIDVENGRVTGVTYFDALGRERSQRAKLVIVSGYAIETPRLLLASACPGFETGLANSSDTVGRYLMVQGGNVVMGRFPDLIRMYKAPPASAMTEEFYETDPRRGFARGFAVQTVGPLPIAFAKQMMVAKGAWGWGMRRLMMDYNHWAALGVLAELLPWPENRVELADEHDRFGLRVAKVTYGLRDNDRQLVRYAVAKVSEILRAAGAEETVQEPRFAHLVGGARMGNDPKTSVVDKFGGAHDLPNLFICDGSILPTQGSANPGLTIQALAARTADYLIAEWQHVSTRAAHTAPIAHVAPRRDLSPRGTAGHGMPRLS